MIKSRIKSRGIGRRGSLKDLFNIAKALEYHSPSASRIKMPVLSIQTKEIKD